MAVLGDRGRYTPPGVGQPGVFAFTLGDVTSLAAGESRADYKRRLDDYQRRRDREPEQVLNESWSFPVQHALMGVRGVDRTAARRTPASRPVARRPRRSSSSSRTSGTDPGDGDDGESEPAGVAPHAFRLHHRGRSALSRYPALERCLLETIARGVLERYGLDASAYPAAVARRLALGAERYGEGAFLDRDNLTELLEETPEVAACSLLELQRLRLAGDLDPVGAHHLLKAAVHGAAADHHARRAAFALGSRP